MFLKRIILLLTHCLAYVAALSINLILSLFLLSGVNRVNAHASEKIEDNKIESKQEYSDEELISAFNLPLPELLKIIVTAQKIEQPIQEVPVAVTSIWSEELEQLLIHDAVQLSQHVPGFSAGEFNIAQPQFYIRGIGSNEDGAAGDNAVIVTVDGAPVSRAAGSLFDFYDLERIEVLRGPQGTLYGRNATGGVINLISKRPSAENSQIVELGLGTLSSIHSRAYLTGAVDEDENYLASLSFSHRQRDGIVNSLYGPELSDINDSGFKAQLYSVGSDNSNWRLISEFDRVRRAGPGRFAVEGLIAAAIAANYPAASDDPFVNLSPYDGFQNRDSFSLTLLAESKLDWANFDSVSGYRQTDIQSQIDQTGVSEQENVLFDLLGVGLEGTNDVNEKSWQFTQELRLNKQLDDWQWLTGIFYLHENTDRTEIFDYLLDSVSFQENSTNSIALFGEMTFDLTEKFRFTVGGRYSWEEKKVKQSAIAGLLVVTEDYQTEAEESWSKFTPRLVLSYSPQKELNSYFSISSGFKSGGFQGQAPNALAAQTPFNEENVLAYELGLKWYSRKNDMRIHTAIYKMNYNDLQVLQLINNPNDPTGVGIIVTENAADAVSQGIEIEWEKLLGEQWLVFGNYSYMDATYKKFNSAEGDFSGNFLRNAPKQSAALAISYQTTLESKRNLNISYSHNYQAIRYQEPANLTYSALPSYQLGKLNIDYQQQEAQWKLSFWIDNVWDETYFIHGFPLLGGGMLTPAPARSYGAKILFTF